MSKYDIYLYENSTVLKNKLNITDEAALDKAEGDFSIELVTKNKIVNQELFYIQRIPQSPNIEAVVEITQISGDRS